MTNDVQNLIERLSKAEARELYNKLVRSKKLTKSPTYIQFPTPVDEIRIYGVAQTCVSKNDVIRHLGEFLLEDLDKMSDVAIKTRTAEMLMFLAEFEKTEDQKRNTLAKAAKIIMELDRDRLMYRIATLAVMNP